MRSQFTHLILTLLTGWIVAALTHRPIAIIPVLASGWIASVFMFAGGPIALWRIFAGVAANGLIFYVVWRFLLP